MSITNLPDDFLEDEPEIQELIINLHKISKQPPKGHFEVNQQGVAAWVIAGRALKRMFADDPYDVQVSMGDGPAQVGKMIHITGEYIAIDDIATFCEIAQFASNIEFTRIDGLLDIGMMFYETETYVKD